MDLRREVVIAASPGRTWGALTDPHQLTQWCCDTVQVDGDRYILKGVSIYGGAWSGRMRDWHPEKSLVLYWTLGRTDTTVRVKLNPVEQEGMPPAVYTRVLVEHLNISEGAVPQSGNTLEMLDAVWALFLRHLKLWLERAEVAGRMDFTSPITPVVERSVVVDRDAETVWRFITEATLRETWFDMEFGPEVDRVEGKRISFSWQHDTPSTVTWSLDSLPDNRTLVLVRHDGLKEDALFNSHLGWQDNLVALAQSAAKPLIRQSVWIDGPVEAVWPFLSTEAGMRAWWNAEMTFEPRIGGRTYSEEHGSGILGRIVEMVPNRKLSFTFLEEGTEAERPPYLITLELFPESNGTRVYVTHSGFERLPEGIAERVFRAYQRGWSDAQELPRLAAAVAAASSYRD